MIYLIYVVNCHFLSVLLHKCLMICFFTSWIAEICIGTHFWSLSSAKKNKPLFLLLTSSCCSTCMINKCIFRRQFDNNVYFLWVDSVSTSFSPIFTRLTSYIPHISLKITSLYTYMKYFCLWRVTIVTAVIANIYSLILHCPRFNKTLCPPQLATSPLTPKLQSMKL